MNDNENYNENNSENQLEEIETSGENINVINIDGTPFDLKHREYLNNKRRECQKLIFEAERNLPTDIIIISYNEEEGRLGIFPSYNSIAETLHLMEVAKHRMMNG